MGNRFRLGHAVLSLVLGAWTSGTAMSAPLLFMGSKQDTIELEDVAQSCNVDAVQDANIGQLHPILDDLVHTTFFRLFRVDLKNPSCPFWPDPKKDKEKDKAAADGGSGTCSGSVPKLGGGILGGMPGKKLSSPFTSNKEMSFSPPDHPPPCSIDSEPSEPAVRRNTSAYGGVGASSLPAPSEADPESLDRTMTVQEQVASQ
ncbi:unnamed protein product, partial [Polarella glacialis]